MSGPRYNIVPIKGPCTMHFHPLRNRIEKMMQAHEGHAAIWSFVKRQRAKDPTMPVIGVSMLKHHRLHCLGLPKFDTSGKPVMAESPAGGPVPVEGSVDNGDDAPESSTLDASQAPTSVRVARDDPEDREGNCAACGSPLTIPTDRMLRDKLKAALYRKVNDLSAKELQSALAVLEERPVKTHGGRTMKPTPIQSGADAARRSRVASALG